MTIELEKLRLEADEAEKRRRMAARRVTFLERLIYQSATVEQFDGLNEELEQAISTAKLYELQALRAKGAYTTADIQARYGSATT